MKNSKLACELGAFSTQINCADLNANVSLAAITTTLAESPSDFHSIDDLVSQYILDYQTFFWSLDL